MKIDLLNKYGVSISFCPFCDVQRVVDTIYVEVGRRSDGTFNSKDVYVCCVCLVCGCVFCKDLVFMEV